jgi:addiction module RelB/DinJ family antitoxin
MVYNEGGGERMSALNIVIDDETKAAADSVFRGYGLGIEEAVRAFIAAVVSRKVMPFAVSDVIEAERLGREELRQRRLAVKGSMKGRIWMADDFDAPLEEMGEYM